MIELDKLTSEQLARLDKLIRVSLELQEKEQRPALPFKIPTLEEMREAATLIDPQLLDQDIHEALLEIRDDPNEDLEIREEARRRLSEERTRSEDKTPDTNEPPVIWSYQHASGFGSPDTRSHQDVLHGVAAATNTKNTWEDVLDVDGRELRAVYTVQPDMSLDLIVDLRKETVKTSNSGGLVLLGRDEQPLHQEEQLKLSAVGLSASFKLAPHLAEQVLDYRERRELKFKWERHA